MTAPSIARMWGMAVPILRFATARPFPYQPGNSGIFRGRQGLTTTTRICLAASGGGHVRQLLDLQAAFAGHPIFFVTEPTPLGESIAADQPTYFVDHFAWGQARLGRWGVMLRSAFANLRSSARIIRRERPRLLVTTGAGSMAPLLLFARLTGARIVLIDSFARFHSPSLFARLAGWLAHVRIAQSAASGAKWPGALVFDPFLRLDGPRPAKQPLLFATVGATLPFPRMIDWTERAKGEGLLPADVIVQTGAGGRQLNDVECHEGLGFKEIGQILDRADIVICHGGTGSIITALQRGCHVIVLPRLFERGEHYDNHQLEIAAAFQERGLLQVATSYEEFCADGNVTTRCVDRLAARLCRRTVLKSRSIGVVVHQHLQRPDHNRDIARQPPPVHIFQVGLQPLFQVTALFRRTAKAADLR
jgi:UDP-N-acetylglucosamine--N-acetylmuramyl-(pentapeptide) pyrophosphoryl-undecaprenol N-acetylglucosamine transferase